MVLRWFHVGRILRSGTVLAGSTLFQIQCRGIKACVLGAMGGIGQPTSLMLKQSKWFEEAALYDIQSCRGLAMELNHIDTPCLVTAYEGEEGLKQALQGSHIILNTAGVPRTLTMTSRDELFKQNASTVYKLAKECAHHCPQAFHLVVTNPVNSMVPIACETYKKMNGCVDPSKIFGVTTVDSMRAATFVADITQTPAETVKVPVIGGHSGTTIVPLLSMTEPSVSLSTEESIRITRAVQYAGDEVLKAKEGTGTAMLSVAYATVKLAECLARSLFGEQGIIECSYVMSNLIPDVRYFSSPLIFGPMGVQKILPLPELNNYEGCLLQTAIDVLKKDIEKGEKYELS